MATVLKLYDGTSTKNLNDGTTWQLLEDWRPRVSGRRRSLLGGESPYEEVIERIPLNVQAATVAAVLEELEDVTEYLDKAYSFTHGAAIPAVVLQYRPDGTGYASDLQAAIIEPPEGRVSELVLPEDFAQQLSTKNVDVQLIVRRRGLWLGKTEQDTSGVHQNQPAVMNVSGGFTITAQQLCPAEVKVTFGGTLLNENPPPFNAVWMIFAGASDKLVLIEAETMTTTAFTSQADTANEASSDDVLRFTPVSTNADESGIANVSASINANARLFAAYAVVRNNTAAKNYAARLIALSGTGATAEDLGATRLVQIPYTNGEPVVIALGVFATTAALGGVALEFTPDATGGTLDVDVLVLQVLDDEASAVVWSAVDAPRGSSVVVGGGDAVFNLDHALLDKRSPLMFIDFESLEFRPGYQGDGVIMMRDALSAVILTAGERSTTTDWLFDGIDAGMTVIRHDAFLAPR